MPRHGIAGSWSTSMLFFKWTSMCSPYWMNLCTLQSMVQEGSLVSIPSPASIVCRVKTSFSGILFVSCQRCRRHSLQTASSPWIFPHLCLPWAPDLFLLSDAGCPRPRTLSSFSLFKPVSKHVSSFVGAFLHVLLSQVESTTWSISRASQSARVW